MKRIMAMVLSAALVMTSQAAAFAAENVVNGIEKTYIFLAGEESGPSVTKIIVELDEPANAIEAQGITLITEGKEHVVDGVYLCDENGNPAEEASVYVAFEVGTEISTGESSGDPFSGTVFSRTTAAISVWADSYQIKLDADSFYVDGREMDLHIDENCINNRICPDAALFNYRSSFSGTYLNNYTGEEEKVTLQIAAYEPESLAGGEKNPLIIWLHGQGEAGVDPDIAILGNEVSALAKDPIQSYFTNGEATGAYVLVPQCETYWMDEGDGTNGEGSGISRYTEILKDTIDDYLEHNPDIDTNRIYIGGCSNGGYMTINMLIQYPEMFAAAYPLCEAYSYYLYERDENGNYVTASSASANGESSGDSEGESAEDSGSETAETADEAAGESSGDSVGDSAEDISEEDTAESAESTDLGMSEGVALVENESAEVLITKSNGGTVLTPDGIWMTLEKIETIKDIPIWFAASGDDMVVNIALYMLPTYTALIQAGAENCYLSLMNGYGHSVWTAFFQNKITAVQDKSAFLDVEIPTVAGASPYVYPVTPNAETGGTYDAGGFNNIFEWLNAQSK